MKSQSGNEIIFYESADGKPLISVRVESETVWLSQSQLVDLFGSSKANVSEHIKYGVLPFLPIQRTISNGVAPLFTIQKGHRL